ncbi:MAG: hypothetical protein RMI00_06535, partial [Sulfolobales archaeon]|nr:hypothetical protein [Sulfolobales archaeon]
TIGESLVELESETKQREIAREEAVEAFLRGDPEWVNINTYLLLKWGPEAVITQQDVMRKLKVRTIAALGMTTKEYSQRVKYEGDERLEELVDSELDKELDKLLRGRVRW